MLASSGDELIYIIAVLGFITSAFILEQIKSRLARNQTLPARPRPGLRELVTSWLRRKARERCPSCGRKLEILSPGWMRCPVCHWHAVDQAKAVAVGLEHLPIEVGSLDSASSK